MRLTKLLLLITVLWICTLASHAGGDKQETQKSVFDTLQSFDDTVLQLALRTKFIDKKLIRIGRDTLVFLSGIDRVRAMLPQLKEYGLTEDAVKTGIELRLRRNGIKVYDVPHDPNGFWTFISSHADIGFFSMADLSLTIETISLSKTDVVAASVRLSQSQTMALLSAERPTFIIAETWHAGQQVIGSRKNVARGCREAIDELVDMYCNDWLATHTDKKTDRLPQDQDNTGPEQRERTH